MLHKLCIYIIIYTEMFLNLMFNLIVETQGNFLGAFLSAAYLQYFPNMQSELWLIMADIWCSATNERKQLKEHILWDLFFL